MTEPIMLNDQNGAVDINSCGHKDGYGRCECGICTLCGERMHEGIHGPVFGHPAGSAPWGHRFRTESETNSEQ